jgi:hypothetical protein
VILVPYLLEPGAEPYCSPGCQRLVYRMIVSRASLRQMWVKSAGARTSVAKENRTKQAVPGQGLIERGWSSEAVAVSIVGEVADAA